MVELLERGALLNAALLGRENISKSVLASLSEAEFSVFSQWGEDGIISWLTGILPDVPQTFVEFGVENYHESNTRYLLQSKNWRGLVIDGSEENIAEIRRNSIYWRHDLSAVRAFIDCDNINSLIEKNGFLDEIGLLSIDIDGNDYWVWQAIDVINPAIVVCEYNAVFGDRHALSVPYRVDFQRSKAHYSNLYFGASLCALIELGKQKGYMFVGTNSNGNNAFFVRGDLAPRVISLIAAVKSFPSLFRESRDSSGQLTFLRGVERVEIIRHLTVYNLVTQSMHPLADFVDLYSPEWQRGMGIL